LKTWSRFWRGLSEVRRQSQSIQEQEIPLNWNIWLRQIHRWLSIAFTVAVIINSIAVARGAYADWLGLLALLPLALLLFTGLYLFALPYATKWRSG
jgi:heme A synthase